MSTNMVIRVTTNMVTMARPARPVILPGAGLWVPEAACALLAHALRGERHPVLAGLRRGAYEVAVTRTDRAARAAGDATGLDVAQAAALLGVTPGRVRQLAASGDLGGYKHAGRWFISRQSVERRLHGDSTRAGAGARPDR